MIDELNFPDDLTQSDYRTFLKWLQKETKAYDDACTREVREKIENEEREIRLLVAETDALTRKLRGF